MLAKVIIMSWADPTDRDIQIQDSSHLTLILEKNKPKFLCHMDSSQQVKANLLPYILLLQIFLFHFFFLNCLIAGENFQHFCIWGIVSPRGAEMNQMLSKEASKDSEEKGKKQFVNFSSFFKNTNSDSPENLCKHIS